LAGKSRILLPALANNGEFLTVAPDKPDKPDKPESNRLRREGATPTKQPMPV